MKSTQRFLAAPAVDRMSRAGLDVELTAYGFRLVYPDDGKVFTGECGSEHNGSISISVAAEPPNEWFFRYSMDEIATFLISAHKLAGKDKVGWIEALKRIDSAYDHEALDRRLAEECPELNGE